MPVGVRGLDLLLSPFVIEHNIYENKYKGGDVTKKHPIC